MKETKHNELYEAPAITIVELKQEGVICISGDPKWNNPFITELNWEEITE